MDMRFTCIIYFILNQLLYRGTCTVAKITPPRSVTYVSDDPGRDVPPKFPVLPGRGWDNLLNREMASVFEPRFTNRRLTEDGQYLLPDFVDLRLADDTDESTISELFEHWRDVTSAVSFSVNETEDVDPDRINGSISAEFLELKKRLLSALAVRVQLRKLHYIVKANANASLSQTFAKRLRIVGLFCTLHRARLAHYEAQRLVQDYGTHVITDVDVGIAAQQVSLFPRSSPRKMDRKALLRAAVGGLFHHIHSSASGEPLRPKRQIADRGTHKPLEALDRTGIPLYEVITRSKFPDIPGLILHQMRQLIKDAIKVYYLLNIRKGCTDPNAPNFSFYTNVDDGSCQSPVQGFSFGGVYQVCEGTGDFDICSEYFVKNPATDDFSCPTSYVPVVIDTPEVEESRDTTECRTCFIFFQCCDPKTETTTATVSAYWCAVQTGSDVETPGYAFGGLYSRNKTNVLTQDMSCPVNFTTLTLLGGDLSICISEDQNTETLALFSFGGLSSCQPGNPYVSQRGTPETDERCPDGFVEQLAMSTYNCDIYYCVPTNRMVNETTPDVQRPPLIPSPPFWREILRGHITSHLINYLNSIRAELDGWGRKILSRILMDEESQQADTDMLESSQTEQSEQSDDLYENGGAAYSEQHNHDRIAAVSVASIEAASDSGTDWAAGLTMICLLSVLMIIITFCCALRSFGNYDKRKGYTKV